MSPTPGHGIEPWMTAAPSRRDCSLIFSCWESLSYFLLDTWKQWLFIPISDYPYRMAGKAFFGGHTLPLKASFRGASMVRASDPVRWGVRPASTNILVAVETDELSASSRRVLAARDKEVLILSLVQLIILLGNPNPNLKMVTVNFPPLFTSSGTQCGQM